MAEDYGCRPWEFLTMSLTEWQFNSAAWMKLAAVRQIERQREREELEALTGR
jgi:hypothetical protein